MKPRYKYRVDFTREFVKGHLKGLFYKDTIRFVTIDSLEAWLASIEKSIHNKTLHWKFAEFKVKRIWI